MTSWPDEELQRIAASDGLRISPLRADNVTFGTPTWIWSVVVDKALYVRAYHGRDSRWYRAAIAQKAGRIHAAGLVRNVAFSAVTGAQNDAIDAAYHAKYGSSAYLGAMIGNRARDATIAILPIETGS